MPHGQRQATRPTSLPPLKGALQNLGSAEGVREKTSARTPRRTPRQHAPTVAASANLPKIRSAQDVPTPWKPVPTNGPSPWEPTPVVVANGHEARSAYNFIGPEIASELEEQVRDLVRKHEHVNVIEQGRGIYVVLERCHSCSIHHALTTRHNESQYANLASSILQHVVEVTSDVVADAVEMLCRLDCAPRSLGCNYALGNKEIWHNASRVGAFEVYLLTPCVAPQTLGGVLHFPPARAREGFMASDSVVGSCGGKRLWGAQHALGVGYVATLLHSKLSSNTWPKERQIVKRLFDSLPLGTVTINVLSSSSLPLSNFTVEVNELVRAPGRNAEEGPPHQLVGNGQQGVCQIEDVPLQTLLEVRIAHSSMKTHVWEFTTTSLRMDFTFGTDIAFQLWIVDIPGGVAIYAGMEEAHPSRIPDKARQFDGKVEMSSGQIMHVQARMQMPWETFNADRIEPATAFSKLSRIFVDGFHPAELEPHARMCSMKYLHQQEFLEIAMLSAPEVHMTVVMPESLQALIGVRLQVENELQEAGTNEQGQCSMILRPGRHVVKLMHDLLTGGWVEQEVIVTGMAPRLQVPLPISVCVWRVPSLIHGKLRASEVWVTAAGEPSVRSNWEPFKGSLQDLEGNVVDVVDGFVQMARYPAVEEDNIGSPTESVAPLSRLSLVPPFLQRVVDKPSGVSSEDAWLHWRPRLLGTIVDESPSEANAPLHGLSVRAMTNCCGAGVSDVKVSLQDGSSCANTCKNGTCSLAGLAGNSSVVVTHSALPGESVQYNVIHAAGSDGLLELPLIFEVAVYIYLTDAPESGGSKQVHGAASLSEIPSDALPFLGRVVGSDGSEIQSVSSPMDQIHRIILPVSHMLPGMRCPLKALQIVPAERGFEWSPEEPSTLPESCALQVLLSKGPMRIGLLKPVATVIHIDGRSLNVAVEDCPAVSDVVTYLLDWLQLPCRSPPVHLVLATQEGSLIHESSEAVVAGQQLHMLAQLHVRVTLGVMQVGVPGVVVSLLDAKKVSGQTGPDGACTLFARQGTYEMALSHALFEGTHRFRVELRDICTTVTFSIHAHLYVFMSALADNEDPRAAAPVWICSHSTHVIAGAQPVAGKLLLRSGNPRGLSLDKARISGVSLEDATRPFTVGVQSGFEPAPKAPVQPSSIQGVALECSFGDSLWAPSMEWLLTDGAAWTALLDGPVCAGWLHPPVTVRCHFFCKVDHKGRPPSVALPAGDHRCVGEICSALAPEYEIPAEQLSVFVDEQRLAESDTVAARSTLDMWPLAPLEVHARSGCCRAGIGNVSVHVRQPYRMDGTPKKSSGLASEGYAGYAGGCIATTAVNGSCHIVTNVGEHSVLLAHPFFESSKGNQKGCVSLSANVCQGITCELEFVSDVVLYVYALPPSPMSSTMPAENFTNVWFCCCAHDIPREAKPIGGKLSIPGIEKTTRIDLNPSKIAPLRLCNSTQSDGCRLKGLMLDVQGGDNMAWCPEESYSCETSCFYTSLMRGHILAGVLKPAVHVRIAGQSSSLRLPVETFATVGAICAHLKDKLGVSQSGIAIFAEGSRKKMDDDVEVLPGQRVSVDPIGILMLRVLVPEGIVAANGSPEGLPNVSVLIDGEQWGETNVEGKCELIVRTGSHHVCLRHPSFKEDRIFDNLYISQGQVTECEAFVDIHLYFYATDAEQEEPDKVVDGPPEITPTLVWVCACCDQIPSDAVDLTGTMHSQDHAGQQISVPLPDAATGSMLLSGKTAELASTSNPAFFLSSLGLDLKREGFLWRAKKPSPLMEREEELGGCEYLRLLTCPVVIGFLEPSLKVHHTSGILELPVPTYRTAGELRAGLVEHLDLSGSDELALYQGIEPLTDDVYLKPGMNIRLLELVTLSLQVGTGCCHEPFIGVSVKLDGVASGLTDSHGRWASMVCSGEHIVTFTHVSGLCMSQKLQVALGKENTYVFAADVCLCIYVTDPDPEIESSSADEDRGPTKDPRCVWVAADASQIPEEARALKGRLTCQQQYSKGRLTCQHQSVDFSGECIAPMALQFGPDSPTGCCPMAGLSLTCSEDGLRWCPKEVNPLAERAAELGGCELLRLMECPACLGFLK